MNILRLFGVGLVFLVAVVSGRSAPPILANPILFVTQPVIPDERNDNIVSNVFVSVVSPMDNHLTDTTTTPRGGDLYIRYPDGSLKNLTRTAGYGLNGAQHTNGIAVREPSVHWSGTKAIFSMVVGAPRFAGDTNVFFWQLYEISGLGKTQTPVITKVPNQPANFNNVSPCYGTDGRIIFASDRPRGGQLHLYPQLDEYLDRPTVTGLWSLDPSNGDLKLLDHAPSGDFTPFVDSFGRIIFTRWDHFVRDRNAVYDGWGATTNGTFNYADETAGSAFDLNDRYEYYPEPRTFDTNGLAALKVHGNALNIFFPWMMNEDGTGLEVLNHVGRHELAQSIQNSFTNDPNLVTFSNPNTRFNTNFINNFFEITEDPLNAGVYFGIDGPDFGTHGSGQIVTLTGPPGLNPDQMFVTYYTPKSTAAPNSAGVYRNPLPTSDGKLLAVYSTASAPDANVGSAAFPKSLYNFRLAWMQKQGATWVTNGLVTAGLTNAVTYWAGTTLVTQTNALWELSPVEVRPRPIPAPLSASISLVEGQVIDEEGIDCQVFQDWLRTNDLALIISRNVTTRDRADRQQPYNLRIAGTSTQTLGTNTGKIYDIRYLQVFQADQRRGVTYGNASPLPGRRVLPTPLHDTTNVNVLNLTGPSGSTKLGDDGSQATIIPARRALTWHLTDTNGASVVKERYWVTFQPGEIRTCTSCHGVNTADQAGHNAPTNAPAALRDLLRFWKQQNGYAKILSVTRTNSAWRLNISAPPNRTNVLYGSTDFAAWTPIGTNSTSTNGIFSLDDSAGVSQRFYKLMIR